MFNYCYTIDPKYNTGNGAGTTWVYKLLQSKTRVLTKLGNNAKNKIKKKKHTILGPAS